MNPSINNIFKGIPPALPEESFQTLAKKEGVLIERIVSHGQATPDGQWYDQEWDEWVILLSGAAGLLIEDSGELHSLQPGDYTLIPAGCRHRVEWTDPSQQTVWLAVHILHSAREEQTTE